MPGYAALVALLGLGSVAYLVVRDGNGRYATDDFFDYMSNFDKKECTHVLYRNP